MGTQSVHLPQKASVEIKETMGIHLRLLLWQRLAGIHIGMCEALTALRSVFTVIRVVFLDE